MSALSRPGGAREPHRLYALLAQYLDALDAGRPPGLAGVAAGHPDLAREMLEFAEAHAKVERLTAPLRELAQAAWQGEGGKGGG